MWVEPTRLESQNGVSMFPTAFLNATSRDIARVFFLFGTLFVVTDLLADRFEDLPNALEPKRARTELDREHLQAATMIMEARILERSDELIPALRKYQRAWRLDRDARVALKQIVPIALKLGRVEEATRYALLLTKSDLTDPFLAERLAMLMADQLEFDRSLQLYRHVLQLRNEEFTSHDPIAMHFEMGRLYFLSKQYEQAAQSFHVVLDAIDNPAKQKLDPNIRDAMMAEPDRLYALFAESFLEAKEYEAALSLFERAEKAKQKKEDGWLDLQKARVDYRAGKFDEAQTKLERYIKQKLSLGGSTPYELLQSLLEKTIPNAGDDANEEKDAAEDEDVEPQGDRKGVITAFRDWLADDPDNFPLMSYVAEMTRRDGGLDDAAQLYEKSIAKQPTIEGYVGLLSTYRQLGDHEKLLDLLSLTLQELNSIEAYREEIAEITTDKKLLGSVFELIRKRIKSGRIKQTEIAVGGLLAEAAKDFDTADEFFRKIRKSADQSQVLITWGIRYLVRGEAQRASQVFRAVLDSDIDTETESVARFYLAGALQLDEKMDEALKNAQQAANLAQDVPDITLRPAWLLYSADKLDQAHDAYSEWLKKYAEDYSIPGTRESVRDARFVMSNICIEKQRVDEAIEWLEKILDEFPNDVGALNDLGYLLVDQNRALARATQMIRIAVEAEPENASYLDSLGWALYRRGNFSEAITHLRKASSTDQPDPIILDHLGDALLASGEASAAEKTWRQALSLIGGDDKPSPAEVELRNELKQKLK